MNNIFENAYFGKPYKTRDERKALLLQINNCALFAIDFGSFATTDDYTLDGKHLHGCSELDIVSEWQEEINEEKLDKLANDVYPDVLLSFGEYEICEDLREAFKAGYLKALEKQRNGAA